MTLLELQTEIERVTDSDLDTDHLVHAGLRSSALDRLAVADGAIQVAVVKRHDR